jgi:PAS domain S-box-containing protein
MVAKRLNGRIVRRSSDHPSDESSEMKRFDSSARLKLYRVFPQGSWRGILTKYFVAISIVGVASLLRYLLLATLGANSFAISLAAILLVAWLTGLSATLLAQTVILMVEIIIFPSEPPREPVGVVRLLLGVGAFYSVGIVVSLLSEIALAAQIRAADKTNEALQERARLRAALACMTDGVLITDRRQCISMMNPAAERMLGSSVAEVLGKPLFSIIQATENDGVQYGLDLVRLAADENRSIQGARIITIKTSGNGSLPVRYSASPMFDADGGAMGAMLVIHDETDRHAAEERLRDADRRKDDFLATLAHELRNPLAPISTGLELMRLSAGDIQAMDEIRGRMERQAKHLVRLVDDLLDVSRITQGKLSLKKERIDLREIVQEAADAIGPKIREAQLQFSTKFPDEACLVDVDPHRIAQVIANLLDNGIKFTKPGGTLSIEVKQTAQTAKINVKDSGIGIPCEQQTSIFGMFTQLTSGKTLSGGAGLGIGLALSRSLMEMHGGKISVHSEGQDCGCEFELSLPAALLQPKEPLVGSRAASHANLPTSRRILVVDDNRDAMAMLGRLLEMLGHTVRMAGDGAEALDVAHEWRPEVIFMDIGMPVINGHEAARRLRQETWAREIVLIATTGWAQEQDRAASRASGFDHHLVKPINLNAIEQVLAKIERQAPLLAAN